MELDPIVMFKTIIKPTLYVICCYHIIKMKANRARKSQISLQTITAIL